MRGLHNLSPVLKTFRREHLSKSDLRAGGRSVLVLSSGDRPHCRFVLHGVLAFDPNQFSERPICLVLVQWVDVMTLILVVVVVVFCV